MPKTTSGTKLKKLKKALNNEDDLMHLKIDDDDDIYEDVDFKVKKKLKKQKLKSEKQNYYVDPEVFKNLINAFYKDNIISDELAMCVSNIATRMMYMPNFINYSYKDDMIGDAKIKCFKALQEKKFNPKTGNPFSYFSVICFNAFVNRIKKENKEHEAIKAYQEEVFNDLVSSGSIEADGHPTENQDEYEY